MPFSSDRRPPLVLPQLPLPNTTSGGQEDITEHKIETNENESFACCYHGSTQLLNADEKGSNRPSNLRSILRPNKMPHDEYSVASALSALDVDSDILKAILSFPEHKEVLEKRLRALRCPPNIPFNQRFKVA